MKSKEVTVGDIVNQFIIQYRSAISMAFVNKPMSYALYQTWKWLDGIENPRKEQNDNTTTN